MSAAEPPEEVVAIDDGPTVWRFDREFLNSNWTCRFGDGCKGILDRDATELGQGCCSLGAHFGDGDEGQAEAMTIAAFAEMIPDERFQFRDTARMAGVFGDAERTHTRVVDGACVFLNRPGFAGGSGCALHLAALDAGERPIDWKPSVCWQLPLHVDFQPIDDARESATVSRWGRAQWGRHGETMAWCCTERADGGEGYVGDEPVIDSLRDELEQITGPEVYVELRRRLKSR
ncbi:MAG: hypothetical protein AAGA42_09660 [Actinomycetota bacterium]